MKLTTYLNLLLLFLITGCSVVMSGTKSGTSVKEISSSKTRTSLIAHYGVEIVDTERDPENHHILYEDYLVQKPKGSTWRAVMHGALDVATLGLWEVVGTPVEMSMGGKSYVPIRVYYNEDEEVERLEYLQWVREKKWELTNI